MTGEEVLKLLTRNGWRVSRNAGSQHIMVHPDFSHSIAVPVHNHEMATGTLHKVLRDAKLK